ncbi:MAG: hypothetical protein ACT4OP_10400 [Actinomycetota bacterium]
MSRDRGSTPVELALGLMIIVVPVAIMALSVAPVFEHRNFVRRAAAEAARTAVLAAADPLVAGETVVADLARGMGIAPADVTVVWCGGMPCSFGRGATVSVEVAAIVREISSFLPIGEITVRSVHTEQVDPYRSRP